MIQLKKELVKWFQSVKSHPVWIFTGNKIVLQALIIYNFLRKWTKKCWQVNPTRFNFDLKQFLPFIQFTHFVPSNYGYSIEDHLLQWTNINRQVTQREIAVQHRAQQQQWSLKDSKLTWNKKAKILISTAITSFKGIKKRKYLLLLYPPKSTKLKKIIVLTNTMQNRSGVTYIFYFLHPAFVQ